MTELPTFAAAAIAKLRDPDARIACPSCSQGELMLHDVAMREANRIARWIICSSCRRHEEALVAASGPTFRWDGFGR